MSINTAQGVSLEKVSPMMRRYLETKKQYPDCILFYRLGDFYEMFFDDAVTVSRALELTLTGRDCGLEDRAAMCGIPYHAAETYTKKLIELGYKVAICEQLEDPAKCTGLVERGVIRIITPGTLLESSMLDESANNWLCCCYKNDDGCSMCFADISTGAVTVEKAEGKNIEENIINTLARFTPSEIIANNAFLNLKNAANYIKVQTTASVSLLEDENFNPKIKKETVLKQFSASEWSDIDVDENDISVYSICGMFSYIEETQKQLVGRFTEINFGSSEIYMTLDYHARRNLELTQTLRTKEKRGSLLWVLDKTCTSMGKRLLKTYIEQPLISPARILARLDAVEVLSENSLALQEIRDILSDVYDLERLMTRVMYKTANPRDLKSLCLTAKQLPELKEKLSQLESSRLLKTLCSQISDLKEITELLERAIVDEPPVSTKDGGIIRDGFNKDLDELRNIMNNGNDFIKEIEEREREKTGIKNLKIGYNRVFGYYLEVTRSYYSLIPEDYIRKQTLANSERFITEELKITENKILGAKEKALVLEEDIFNSLREFLAARVKPIQQTAESIAQTDVLASFAEASIQNNYTKPDIAADGILQIKNGRHPVVENMMTEELFVPNDTYADNTQNRLLIITGPNMAGKSTYMRQVALIVLMAQMGCFVPADYAKISVCDRIFTRVGASDDLAAGQSTFMVEMQEVADILKYATKDSLVILDEVGRGTSTSDGLSIAEAVAEYISQSKNLGCKTLFATHYHELIELEGKLDGVRNLSIAVKKAGDTIKFLRKIVPGGADKSYGIEVAKLAGIPKKVIKRANELLEKYENEDLFSKKKDTDQISFADMEKENTISMLTKTNIGEMSDDECREMLAELQRVMRE